MKMEHADIQVDGQTQHPCTVRKKRRKILYNQLVMTLIYTVSKYDFSCI